jgi:hypothetical protein
VGKIQGIKVVIDTNVVVSGLLFQGVPGRIVSLWQKKAIRPFITQEMIDEYLKVLAYPKFQLSGAEIEYVMHQEILPYFEPVTASSDIHIVSADPDDDKFIHCALAGSVDIIISGDKHLLDLGEYRSISILQPAQFLQRFNRD